MVYLPLLLDLVRFKDSLELFLLGMDYSLIDFVQD